MGYYINSTYHVQVIRDKIRLYTKFPREIQNIITEYAICIGDLLYYIVELYPDVSIDDYPLVYIPEGHNVRFYIFMIRPLGRMKLVDCFCNSKSIQLDGEDDPLEYIIQRVKLSGFCINSDCIFKLRYHTRMIADACMKHLLSH